MASVLSLRFGSAGNRHRTIRHPFQDGLPVQVSTNLIVGTIVLVAGFCVLLGQVWAGSSV